MNEKIKKTVILPVCVFLCCLSCSKMSEDEKAQEAVIGTWKLIKNGASEENLHNTFVSLYWSFFSDGTIRYCYEETNDCDYMEERDGTRFFLFESGFLHCFGYSENSSSDKNGKYKYRLDKNQLKLICIYPNDTGMMTYIMNGFNVMIFEKIL